MVEINKTAQTLCRAFANPKVTLFVTSILSKKYKYHFPNNKRDVGRMVKMSIDDLVSAHRTNELSRDFIAVSQRIHTKIYANNSWFNKLYKNYKIKTTPYYDYLLLRPYLSGVSVLDFGGGAGYMAIELRKQGFNVFITDVLDYRIKEVKDIGFHLMKHKAHINFNGMRFDNVIARTVLHHIDSDILPTILKKLHKVTNRLIMLEDVYGLEKESDVIQADIPFQKELQVFMKFTLVEQRQILMLFDYYGNSIVQGVHEMNFPFDFKPVKQWKKQLAENGWNVTNVEVIGFDIHNLHRPCQAWFVAEG